MTTRRHLLAGLAAAPAAGLLSARAQDQPAAAAAAGEHAELITGNGPFRYRIERAWGQPAPGKDFGPTHGGVLVLPSGEIACSTDNPQVGIAIFSAEGQHTRQFGPAFTHSLDLHQEGGRPVIWATDLGSARALKLDLEGNTLLEIKAPAADYDDVAQWKPTASAVAPDGTVFIADGYRSGRIFKYAPDGSYLGSIGEKGGAEHQLSNPHGLALETRFGDPCLLVCDREKRRLIHLGFDGKLLNVWSHGLRRPCTTRVKGDLTFVTEILGRTTILDKDGVPVAFLGDNPDQKQWDNFNVGHDALPAASFTAAHGLDLDADGNLFVLEWNTVGRVTKLVPVQNG